MNRHVLELMKIKQEVIRISDHTKDIETWCELDELMHEISKHLNKAMVINYVS